MDLLVRSDWRGNVRDLRSMAARLVVTGRHRRHATLPAAELSRLRAAVAREQTRHAPEHDHAGPADATDEAVLEALRANGWVLARTARALGWSKGQLDRFIDASDTIHRATDFTEEAIRAALDRHDGDYHAAATDLGAPPKGLKDHLTKLQRARTGDADS